MWTLLVLVLLLVAPLHLCTMTVTSAPEPPQGLRQSIHPEHPAPPRAQGQVKPLKLPGFVHFEPIKVTVSQDLAEQIFDNGDCYQ